MECDVVLGLGSAALQRVERSMDAKLVLINGDAQTKEFHIKLPSILGRSRSADLKLGHSLVSRKHCELYEEDGKLVVRDLGSLNGTFIGDSRISEPTVLPPGGTITIGAATFRAVYGDMTAQTAAEEVVPDFLAPPATEVQNANPAEQTLEVEPPLTESTGENEAEGGFDLGWLEEESPDAEVAVEADVPLDFSDDRPAMERNEPEAAVEDELSFPDVAVAEDEEVASDDAFAPPEEQPAASSDEDDDLNDFFASLE